MRMDMPRVTEILRDAQALAEFSNLKPGEIEYFRNNYADFAPNKWWDQTVVDQTAVQKARNRFIDEQNKRSASNKKPLEEKQLTARLLELEAEASNVRTKQWQITQGYLRAWWGRRIKDDIQSFVILLD